jgi:hypothetical protein
MGLMGAALRSPDRISEPEIRTERKRGARRGEIRNAGCGIYRILFFFFPAQLLAIFGLVDPPL